MATSLSTALANALADLIDTRLQAGAGAPTIDWTTSGDSVLAVTTLSDPDPFGAAAAGVITLAGTPKDSAAATAAGDMAKAKFEDGDGVQEFECAVATSASDINFAGGVTVAINDTVRLTSFTVTVSGA